MAHQINIVETFDVRAVCFHLKINESNAEKTGEKTGRKKGDIMKCYVGSFYFKFP